MSSIVSSQKSRHRFSHHICLSFCPQVTPDALKNHTSGTYIPFGEEQWSESTLVPFKDVPNVGFSDMEFYYDETGAVVPGQFFCMSDNGFGYAKQIMSITYCNACVLESCHLSLTAWILLHFFVSFILKDRLTILLTIHSTFTICAFKSPLPIVTVNRHLNGILPWN